MKALKGLSSAVLLLWLMSFSQAQNLNLFQETDQALYQSNNLSTPQNASNLNATKPAFRLRGTSRFGGSYFTSLLDRDDKAIYVQWSQGGVSNIEGHQGYVVVDVNSKEVSIRLPAEESCIESLQQRVSCPYGGDGIALLRISNAEPMAAKIETALISPATLPPQAGNAVPGEVIPDDGPVAPPMLDGVGPGAPPGSGFDDSPL